MAVVQNVIADPIDQGQSAGGGFEDILNEIPVSMVMRGQIAGIDVHELDGEIDPPAGGGGFIFTQDILLPQNGNLVLDQKLGGCFPIGDDRPADNDSFFWF